MIRLQQGAPAQLSMTWHDGTAAVDPGAVTVSVVDALGNPLLTDAPASGTGAGPRTIILPASATAELTLLTAIWSSSFQSARQVTYEVVGANYIALGELRQVKDLGDPTKVSTETLVEAIDWWTDLVEGWTGQSFIPRYARLSVRHRAGQTIYLRPHPRTLLRASSSNALLTSAGWYWDDDGSLHPDRLLPAGPLVIDYTYGLDGPDEELRRAARIAIRSTILTDRTGPPSRQTLLSNELGTVRLAQPGPNAATGIPEVDRVLNSHRYQPVMVG